MPIPKERNESNIQTDVTVYGATSFVARHILHYLIDVSPSLTKKLKVTLAGRNESKLKGVLDNMTPRVQEKSNAMALDVVVANSTDLAALKKMTTRTRVVINCAGPFELYSSGVVQACAETGCDYVDITGEVNWVGDMRMQFGSAAAKSGARIISLCGFDSVPSDLSVFAAVQALRKTVQDKDNVEITSARTWHDCYGMAGGGTLATMQNMKVDAKKCLLDKDNKLRKVPWFIFDPLVLAHPETERFNPNMEVPRNQFAWSEWTNWLPYPHTILKQGVSIPFFMCAANAKVVQASALALNYGPNFAYHERFLPLGFERTVSFGLFSFLPSLFALIGMAILGAVMKVPILGNMIVKVICPPGTGASDAQCESGHTIVYAEVKSPLPDQRGRVACANCYMEFKGDPGNWATAQCVSESALSLVLNRKELPSRSADGFGTPAQLLGSVLVTRLKESKVRPVLITTNVRTNERDHEYKLYLPSKAQSSKA